MLTSILYLDFTSDVFHDPRKSSWARLSGVTD